MLKTNQSTLRAVDLFPEHIDAVHDPDDDRINGCVFETGGEAGAAAWQNITISPIPAPTLSTATTVFEPGRNLVGSFSSTS
jgi:hypothetical protein